MAYRILYRKISLLWTIYLVMILDFIKGHESFLEPIIPETDILLQNHWVVFLYEDTPLETIENLINDIEKVNGSVRKLYSPYVHEWVIESDELVILLEQYNPFIQIIELEFIHEHKLVFSGSDSSDKVFNMSKSKIKQYDKCKLQSDPPNNLDRIDQKELPIDKSYSWIYDGKGVNVYVVDSGIAEDHEGFETEIIHAYSAYDSIYDCNGHGTHVSGIIASKYFGVAKGATLHSVKVLDCEGFSNSAKIIEGLQWIKNNYKLPGIVQLSLAGAKSSTVDEVIKDLYELGLVIISAAGNDAIDACEVSPARSPYAITVGAVDNNDIKSTYSNYGECLNIFAPGNDIPSINLNRGNKFEIKSGTSMAAPHVTGVAAQILEKNPTWKPSQVYEEIIKSASYVVKNSNSTTSLLVNTPFYNTCKTSLSKSNALSNLEKHTTMIYTLISFVLTMLIGHKKY